MTYTIMRILWANLLIFSFLMAGCATVSDNDNDNANFSPIPKSSGAGCYLENYPDPKTSQYILPYEVGKLFLVSQGNCGRYSTHKPRSTAVSAGGVVYNTGDIRYAYDFNIPIGNNILATRGGTVRFKEDRFSNLTNGFKQENYVVIEHSDGTAGIYVHLSPKNMHVEVGDTVSQGDVIGIAGNSGYTGSNPHLHFHVLVPPFIKCSFEEGSGCKTIPVTFRNSQPLDAPLIEGSTYKAVEF